MPKQYTVSDPTAALIDAAAQKAAAARAARSKGAELFTQVATGLRALQGLPDQIAQLDGDAKASAVAALDAFLADVAAPPAAKPQ